MGKRNLPKSLCGLLTALLLCFGAVFGTSTADAITINYGESVKEPGIVFQAPMLLENGRLSALNDSGAVFSRGSVTEGIKFPVTFSGNVTTGSGCSLTLKENGWNTLKYDFVGYSVNGVILSKNGGSTNGRLDLTAYLDNADSYFAMKNDGGGYCLAFGVNSGESYTEVKRNISVVPLFAKKAPPKNNISVRAATGGSVEYAYVHSEYWLLTAIPDANYDFVGWEKSVDGGKTWQDAKLSAYTKVQLNQPTAYRAVFAPVKIVELQPVAYALPSTGDTLKLEAKIKFSRPLDGQTQLNLRVYEGRYANESKLLGVAAANVYGEETDIIAAVDKRPSADRDIDILLVASLPNGETDSAVYKLVGTLDVFPAEQTVDTLAQVFFKGENTLRLTATGDPQPSAVKWRGASAEGIVEYSMVSPQIVEYTLGTKELAERIDTQTYRADAGDGRVAYAAVNYSSGLQGQVGLKLEDSAPLLQPGETKKIAVVSSFTEASLTLHKVVVTSSNEKVLTAEILTDKGKLYDDAVQDIRLCAVGKGTATLTIACGDVVWSCPVTVLDREVKIYNAEIPQKSVQVAVGDSLALTAVYEPDYALADLQWISEDPDIATVSAGGVVTGKSAGTAEITARVYDMRGGMQTAACKVKVTDEPYNVSIYVPKQYVPAGGLSIYPCAGLDENNRDTFDEAAKITDYQVSSDGDYNIYKLELKRGAYSYRATDANGKSLGGGTFALPAEYNGESEDGYYPREDTRIYLRLTETYITNEDGGHKPAAADFTVTHRSSLGVAANGEPYINEQGYVCYPSLLYVNGNALLYYTNIRPAAAYSASYGLGSVSFAANAIAPGVDKLTIAQPLGKSRGVVINTPAGAEVTLYEKLLNYASVPVQEISATPLADGTVDHLFNRGSATSFRVTMAGKRPQASYFSYCQGDRIVVTFPEDADPKAQDTKGGAFDESSLLLNVNERNKLSLNVGEQFKLRPFRAWQIIDTITNNEQIAPDFHYNVISGEDVVEVAPLNSGNNAGNDWAWIKALKEGVAVIEVSYDAIDIINGNRAMWGGDTDGFYGATDPNRTGVLVVTVGKDYGDVSGIDWDAEFETVYFLEDTGIWQARPAGSSVSLEVAAVKNGRLSGWRSVKAEQGVFAVPIAAGNNIVKITADGVTDYRIVRGAQVTPHIEVVGVEDASQIYPGDTVKISFTGLYQPVPKLGGIYNPGFPATMFVSYEVNGQKVTSPGTQYHIIQPDANYVTFTIPESASGSLTLNGGILYGTMMSNKPLGGHRDLTDMGMGAVFNAGESKLLDNYLPDITLKLAEGVRPADRQTNALPGQTDTNAPVQTQTAAYYQTEGLDFSKGEYGIDAAKADGYVTVSFEDFGIRTGDADLPTPLGQIITPTQVPYQTGDSMAIVTLRLLDALGIGHQQTGTSYSAFYLAAITDFKLADGTDIAAMGEFRSGSQSGWMVTLNDWFVNSSTADFKVEDGDIIRWQNTCQLGADIGADWQNPDASITGIKFAENYGTLSPQFTEGVKSYVYEIPATVKSIKLQASLSNYWSQLSCTADGQSYKPLRAIPVKDGTVITLSSKFIANIGEEPSDTDEITITVRYKN